MKSLTTDEIGLDEALAREGIAAWETDLAEMSRAVGGVSIRMPTLAAMAFAADRYWEPRLDFLQSRSPQSFGGLYTFLFRNYSGLVHASFRGLNRVTVDVPDDRKRVVVQAPLETLAPVVSPRSSTASGSMSPPRHWGGRPRTK